MRLKAAGWPPLQLGCVAATRFSVGRESLWEREVAGSGLRELSHHSMMEGKGPTRVSPQALDGAFTPDNRERCHEATAPLIEAVENLTAFASNPEFATIPAQISPEVGRGCWGLGRRKGHLWAALGLLP